MCKQTVFLSRLTELPNQKFSDYLSFNVVEDKDEETLYGLPLPQSQYEILKGGKIGAARIETEEEDKENSGPANKNIVNCRWLRGWSRR